MPFTVQLSLIPPWSFLVAPPTRPRTPTEPPSSDPTTYGSGAPHFANGPSPRFSLEACPTHKNSSPRCHSYLRARCSRWLAMPLRRIIIYSCWIYTTGSGPSPLHVSNILSQKNGLQLLFTFSFFCLSAWSFFLALVAWLLFPCTLYPSPSQTRTIYTFSARTRMCGLSMIFLRGIRRQKATINSSTTVISILENILSPSSLLTHSLDFCFLFLIFSCIFVCLHCAYASIFILVYLDVANPAVAPPLRLGAAIGTSDTLIFQHGGLVASGNGLATSSSGVLNDLIKLVKRSFCSFLPFPSLPFSSLFFPSLPFSVLQMSLQDALVVAMTVKR